MSKKKLKKRIEQQITRQNNREDRREHYEVHRNYSAPQPYTEALKHCVRLIHSGMARSDATYATRLHFTDPSSPGYIPIERWNSKEFSNYLHIWFKRD